MEIIQERQKKYKTEYNHEFTWREDSDGGYSFPCDKFGNSLIDPENECALKNYQKCLSGEYDVIDRGIKKSSWSYIENPIGICDNCGHEVELSDEFCGACQCENCGEWYNLYGQHINPPSMWEEPIEAEDYY